LHVPGGGKGGDRSDQGEGEQEIDSSRHDLEILPVFRPAGAGNSKQRDTHVRFARFFQQENGGSDLLLYVQDGTRGLGRKRGPGWPMDRKYLMNRGLAK
jgi:hypothetical protein